MNTVTIPEQKYGQLIPSDTINLIAETIAERFSPEKIILFGSYASSNPNPDSDVDLMIIMHSDLPVHKRAVPILLTFQPMPCSMDILVYTPDEVMYWNGTLNHIITEVFKTGKVMYERTKNRNSKSMGQKSGK